jgi:glycosyltransferase involved in cell wall biosynthesis
MKLRRTRPTLMHVHQTWPHDDGVSASLTDAAGVRFRTVTAHGGRSPESMTNASRRAVERAEIVTTTCDAFVEQLMRECGLTRDRLRRVPAGVDAFDEESEHEAARLVRDRCGAGLIRPLWVFAGRLEPHRGCQVFIEALGLARDRGLPFVALVVGDGPQQDELEGRVASLGLATSVHFVPTPDDPGPLLLAADTVVFPSLWDGASAVLPQALIRGRPVIASAVGGAPDVIENGITGRLVPPGDARAVADALESFHRRPEAAQRLGREAAAQTMDELLWPRVVEAYEAVYDEVLGLATFTPERAAVARGRW